MALEQKLSLKLSQKLVMTPALQQAIKLLQMTRLELEGVLNEELEENPLLEEPEEDAAEEEGELETKEEEPDDASMDDIDLDAYFNEYLEGSSEHSSGTYEPREAVPIEATLAGQEDFYDYLLWQLHMLELSDEQREIAELIIGNLDEDGFLVATLEEICLLGASDEAREAYLASEKRRKALEQVAEELEEIEESGEANQNGTEYLAPARAADDDGGEADLGDEFEVVDPGATASPLIVTTLATESADQLEPEESSLPGYSMKAVEEALATVRSLDPPGVAYGSLRESLLAQLEERGEEESITYRLVDEFWQECLKRQFPAIAKEMGVPLQKLKEPSEHIASLETRPGRKYSVDKTQYVEPDVHIVNVGGQFVVQINDDGLPRLRVSKAYRSMLRKMKAKGDDPEAQQYIKEKMRSAMWLIKSLDQRQRTIYKVAESIVKQQQAFFEKGIEHLRPMVLRDVAEDIEMHESTVSRVVSNKYMNTPRGLYPMKFFFHSGIDRDMGGDISSLTVKRKIKHLIEGESPKKPLSDSALMKKLKAEGIQIARRTVAKYRDELNIPSSTDRKQVF